MFSNIFSDKHVLEQKTKMLDVSDRIFEMEDGRVMKIETRDEIDLQVGKLDGEEVG